MSKTDTIQERDMVDLMADVLREINRAARLGVPIPLDLHLMTLDDLTSTYLDMLAANDRAEATSA